MAQTTSVLWSVDQGLGENAKEQARKNIGAYEDKTNDGGIPRDDLASDVQVSLAKADSIDDKVLRIRYESTNTLRFYRGILI